MRLALKWLVSLGIGALFVWLSFREWPVDRLVCDHVALEGADLVCAADGGGWRLTLPWVLAAFAVLSVVHFLRVLRWRPLLEPLAHHDFRTLNRVCAVSFMALFLFPLRLGELARPFLIASHGKVRKSAVFGTVAMERVMDGLMMALLLFVVLVTLPVDRDSAAYYSLRAGSVIAAGVFLAALGILALAHYNKTLAIRWIRRLLAPLSRRLSDKIGGMVERFIDGLKALPTARAFFFAVLWTVLYWLTNGFFYWFLALGFGLGPWVSLPVAWAMMAAVAVGMMIPNPPGNVGSFWYFLLLPLYVTGAPDQGIGALVFALAVWALMLTQYVIFGGYFLVTGKIDLRRIWQIQKEHVIEETGEGL